LSNSNEPVFKVSGGATTGSLECYSLEMHKDTMKFLAEIGSTCKIKTTQEPSMEVNGAGLKTGKLNLKQRSK
jgi:hypothetical protein